MRGLVEGYVRGYGVDGALGIATYRGILYASQICWKYSAAIAAVLGGDIGASSTIC